MAKKQDVNQTAEIRAITEQLGKDANFKDVFAKLQAKFPGHKFNPNSCQQALTLARQKLGYITKSKNRRTAAAKQVPTTAARVVPAGRPQAVRSANGLVVDALTTAQKLIAACGGKEAAKHVIDNVTV